MSSHHEYMVIDVAELGAVDFDQILETDPLTVRKSTNDIQTIVKWDGVSVPSSVDALPSKQGPYTHAQARTLMATSAWSPPIP